MGLQQGVEGEGRPVAVAQQAPHKFGPMPVIVAQPVQCQHRGGRCFVGDVQRLVAVAEQAGADRMHHRVVPLDKDGQRGLVASPGSRYLISVAAVVRDRRAERGPFRAIRCLPAHPRYGRQERMGRNVGAAGPGGCGAYVRQQTRSTDRQPTTWRSTCEHSTSVEAERDIAQGCPAVGCWWVNETRSVTSSSASFGRVPLRVPTSVATLGRGTPKVADSWRCDTGSPRQSRAWR